MPTDAQREIAAVTLACYLRPELWLARRTDSTIIRETWEVHWSTRLEVFLDLDELSPLCLTLPVNSDGSRSVVLPVMLKNRRLLPTSQISDDRGQSVHTLTLKEAGPLLECIMLSTAQSVLASAPRPEIREALKSYAWATVESPLGAAQLLEWAKASAASDTPELLQTQAAALLSDPVMRVLLLEWNAGRPMLATVPVRPDSRSEIVIEHEYFFSDGDDVVIWMIGAAPNYEFRLRLPDGLVWRHLPDLTFFVADAGERTAEHKISASTVQVSGLSGLEVEVHGGLFAGSVSSQPLTARGASCLLRLSPSIRSAPDGLVPTVTGIAYLTASLFLAGTIARIIGWHPATDTAAALLLAFPNAYAAVVLRMLQRSDIPIEHRVTRGPRRTLFTVVGVTIAGAADLAVHIPAKIPVLSQFGWGVNAALWVMLTCVAVLLAAYARLSGRNSW